MLLYIKVNLLNRVGKNCTPIFQQMSTLYIMALMLICLILKVSSQTNSEITLVSRRHSSITRKKPAFKFCQYLYEQNDDVELLVFGRSYKNSDKEWKSFMKIVGFVQNNELPRFLRGDTFFPLTL